MNYERVCSNCYNSKGTCLSISPKVFSANSCWNVFFVFIPVADEGYPPAICTWIQGSSYMWRWRTYPLTIKYEFSYTRHYINIRDSYSWLFHVSVSVVVCFQIYNPTSLLQKCLNFNLKIWCSVSIELVSYVTCNITVFLKYTIFYLKNFFNQAQ